MKKERMVTRTVNATKVEVMYLTISNAFVGTSTYTLTGKLDKENALQVVKEQYETDEFKPVAVVAIKTDELLYGMTEQQFIENANILPSRKVYGKESENGGE